MFPPVLGKASPDLLCLFLTPQDSSFPSAAWRTCAACGAGRRVGSCPGVDVARANARGSAVAIPGTEHPGPPLLCTELEHKLRLGVLRGLHTSSSSQAPVWLRLFSILLHSLVYVRHCVKLVTCLQDVLGADQALSAQVPLASSSLLHPRKANTCRR